MSLIRVEHLAKEFKDATPLTDVSFEVNEGDVISIIGPSGAGKSTLLRCLNRLEEPTSGKVWVDGEDILDPACDIARVRRKMGMVFQSFNLFGNLDAIGNVTAAPMRLLHVPREQAMEEGMALLERVGLKDVAHRFPDELSGGQQQRVAIARAIAMNPAILMLDEPTSALDPTMVQEVLTTIRTLARESMTMMCVTHEMGFAQDVSNRVFYLDEGIIYEEGSPAQIFEHPERPKTRQFIMRLKTADVTLNVPNVDVLSAMQEIERFARDAAIADEEYRKVLLIFEGLVAALIVPHLRDQGAEDSIKVHLESSQTGEGMSVEISWPGDPFNPLEETGDVRVDLLKATVRELRYAHDDLNRIIISL